jgi:hypothetical protein
LKLKSLEKLPQPQKWLEIYAKLVMVGIKTKNGGRYENQHESVLASDV